MPNTVALFQCKASLAATNALSDLSPHNVEYHHRHWCLITLKIHTNDIYCMME